MEPRGCNWWQAVANAAPPGTAKSSQTVAVGCDCGSAPRSSSSIAGASAHGSSPGWSLNRLDDPLELDLCALCHLADHGRGLRLEGEKAELV